MSVEETRRRFRPPRILTLFVGESAPIGGTFFYYGNTGMARYMKEAVEEALGVSDNFLDRFKSYGWFLDDLILRPVNHLGMAERRQSFPGMGHQARFREEMATIIPKLPRADTNEDDDDETR